MKLRSVLLFGILALVGATLTATIAVVAGVLERAARSDVSDQLVRNRQVFEELQSYRQLLFRSETRVVAEEPRLRAVAAAQEVSHETVVGVALDLRKVLRSDLFLLTDGQGRLLA